MGKIVKFCTSCDEGFAEKFGFCPNCGQSLQTFEMNPVVPAAPPVEEVAPATIAAEEAASPAEAIEAAPPEAFVEAAHDSESVSDAWYAAEPIAKVPVAAEPLVVDPIEPEPIEAEPVAEEPVAVEAIAVEPIEAEPIEAEPIAVAPIAAEPVVETVEPEMITRTSPYFQQKAVDVDRKPASLEAAHDAAVSDGGYYVTVMEEKNVKQRNSLLLGTFGFMVFCMLGLTVYSLFASDLGVGAIGGDDMFLASLVDAPMAIEEEKQKKDKDDGGGGGGGGREEEQEVNKGDLADQSPNPQRAPDVHVPRMDSSIVLPPASTQGNQKFDKKYDRFGDPNGRFDSLSNGPGSGGGIGSGRGTGQGNGNGTGAGNGNGSGFGNGDGNGNGNGTGDGDGGPPPPPRPVGVTKALSIISKPRPGYTDAARQANIQGTVILRVTFLANGQIGPISPVKGLPNGLTEQAIAAARRISFDPKKVDGVGQSVTRQIEYTFSIY